MSAKQNTLSRLYLQMREKMNKFAIIADDQTGAGDSGIHFARSGRVMALMIDYDGADGKLEKFDGVTISTDTRFHDSKKAAEQVGKVINHCLEAGYDRFFKKIDSTMRGNTGSEIVAAVAATHSKAALICPAIPKLGRTCLDGVIMVNDQPLAESDMGQDPFHPLTTSTISKILEQQIDLPCCHLSLAEIRGHYADLMTRVRVMIAEGCCLIIADAEVQQDLNKLAALLEKNPDILPVGAAGLAEAISMQFEQVVSNSAPDVRPGRMLAVVGSLTEISRAQVEFARAEGHFQILELDVVAAKDDLEAETDRLVAEIRHGSGGHLLLRTKVSERHKQQPALDGELVAELLGNVTRVICQEGSCSIVFTTGGSTSMGVARALDIKVVTLRQELMPGVVLGECQTPGLGVRWFVTKAGGFGHEQTLNDLAEYFTLQTEDKEIS